jgi:hypothetical protein
MQRSDWFAVLVAAFVLGAGAYLSTFPAEVIRAAGIALMVASLWGLIVWFLWERRPRAVPIILLYGGICFAVLAIISLAGWYFWPLSPAQPAETSRFATLEIIPFDAGVPGLDNAAVFARFTATRIVLNPEVIFRSALIQNVSERQEWKWFPARTIGKMDEKLNPGEATIGLLFAKKGNRGISPFTYGLPDDTQATLDFSKGVFLKSRITLASGDKTQDYTAFFKIGIENGHPYVKQLSDVPNVRDSLPNDSEPISLPRDNVRTVIATGPPKGERAVEVTLGELFVECRVAVPPVTVPASGLIYWVPLWPVPAERVGGGLIELSLPKQHGEPYHFTQHEGLTSLYECRITNYGQGPIFAVNLTFMLKYSEALGDTNRITVGKTVLERPWPIQIAKIDQGLPNQFVFYFVNQEPMFIEVQMPQEATYRALGTASMQKTLLTYHDATPIILGPGQQPTPSSPKSP